uniref:Uncharacterized protein n=1 Tax=Panagrolaimus davidi TaxID=227884 RepID=A0A914QXQ7_9BILA
MHTFMFIIAILLLFSSFFNFVAADDDDLISCYVDYCCNQSLPLFPESKGEEIHALLPRDRYINFVGWNPGKIEYEGVGPEKIPYGYLKEMLVHFTAISEEDGPLEARIFLTSMEKNETIVLHEIKSVENVYISKDGTKYPDEHLYAERYHPNECTKYAKEYSNIDGLLIEINCKTTDVKKILVKCEPY